MTQNPEHSRLFRDLRENRLGERVRLEQERVGYAWLRARIPVSLAI